MSDQKNGLSRRDFLKNGAFAAAAMGVLPGAKKAPQMMPESKTEIKADPKVDPSKILNYHPDMRYRRLGNTDIYLSVISLGGIGIDKSVMMYGVALVPRSSYQELTALLVPNQRSPVPLLLAVAQKPGSKT